MTRAQPSGTFAAGTIRAMRLGPEGFPSVRRSATVSAMDVIERTRRLVAIESVSSADDRFDTSNRAVIDLVAEWVEALGCTAEVVPVPYHPSKANLIATLGSGEGGLVLSGHGDTVPFDRGAWETDPFSLVERDGKLFGLGSADMKGAIAAMVEAAAAFASGDLRAPLHLVVTADEESGMGGARALEAIGRPAAAHAVIGEPTSLEPVSKHKGIFQEALTLAGRSGHSSDPSLGNSALEAMVDAMEELRAFRRELEEAFRDETFEVSHPTLNLGSIHGGDSPNRICASCELRFDLRSIPGMPPNDDLRRGIRERIELRLAKRGIDVHLSSLFDGIPPFATSGDAELVSFLEELTGARARAVMFATEAPFFSRMGMDAVILGPGDIAVAHQPNEFVPKDGLVSAVDVYRRTIQRFCVEGST